MAQDGSWPTFGSMFGSDCNLWIPCRFRGVHPKESTTVGAQFRVSRHGIEHCGEADLLMYISWASNHIWELDKNERRIGRIETR